jgi:CheY-like chemotaxis protein
LNVLIIDDSDLARAQIRRILGKANIKVFEQASAIGATRKIIANAIDVALVDISMPGLSGDKLVRLLRNNPRLTGLLIVVVSAKAEEELNGLIGPAMANAVLTKDRVESDLVQLLRRLSTRAKRLSGAQPDTKVEPCER